MLYLKIPIRYIDPKASNAEELKERVLEDLSAWHLAGFAFDHVDVSENACIVEEDDNIVQMCNCSRVKGLHKPEECEDVARN